MSEFQTVSESELQSVDGGFLTALLAMAYGAVVAGAVKGLATEDYSCGVRAVVGGYDVCLV